MTSTRPIAVVGAGFTGAVIAESLANRGLNVVVFDSRDHIAGNCHTERDPETGVMLHRYGPHIFHTSNREVWEYVQRFGKFVPYTNRVKAIARGAIYPLPINLMTINQFFGKLFSPAEAAEFIKAIGDTTIDTPTSFEDQALKFLGRDLYAAFFRGYTIKQWGVDPAELPASILKRLPVRFNYNDNYYDSIYQAIPELGYTSVVENILRHDRIQVRLGTEFTRESKDDYAHVFYSGPLDAWYGFDLGRLRYRTLDFAAERHTGDYQGNAVINYCDEDIPWTRISEHKHFAPWESHEKTVIFKEYSRSCGPEDVPYYPVRLLNDKALLTRYLERARTEDGVTFVGRLGTYRYLDMHVAVEEALLAGRTYHQNMTAGLPMPAFVIDPLG